MKLLTATVWCHFPSPGSRTWEGGKQDRLLRVLWVLHIPASSDSELISG